jgi:CRP/FNR family nitrogen fixation transcriptional regulator
MENIASYEPAGRQNEHLALKAKRRAGAQVQTRRYRRDERISSPQRQSWCRVVSGAARHCVLRADGRRQIVDLLLPGDLFNFGAPAGSEVSVEAIVEGTMVASYPEHDRELADDDDMPAADAHQVALDTIARLQRQLLMLGRLTAAEKVGAFLLDMAARLGARCGGGFVLPLSRYDIADYLAVSVETVSRSLTDLERRGAISLAGARNIRILDDHVLDAH